MEFTDGSKSMLEVDQTLTVREVIVSICDQLNISRLNKDFSLKYKHKGLKFKINL